jgi:peptidoglycan-associated lipoprotein
MRIFKLSMLVVLTASLVLGGAGCKRKPKPTTVIPGNQVGQIGTPGGGQQPPVVKPDSGFKLPSDNTAKALPAGEDLKPTDAGTPLSKDDISQMERVPDFFKANTVYFDFDRSAVRASERVRVEEVAAYLKGQPTHMVQIEGHCDERGTEEYNRALGERRALAVREYLINAGVGAERVHTISFGEDRPAEIGSSEGAWAKNRRGEFILLKPRR